MKTILNADLPNIKLFKKGKVRDVYNLDDKLLIVVTDRISAFDIVLNAGIPNKGRVLTELSGFWFNFTSDIIKNHMITTDIEEFPKELLIYKETLAGRSMLVKKTSALPIECVVRGYISGTAWKDYIETGAVCGIKLPDGLRESEKLSEPIFTPSTKAESGHDENITEQNMISLIGSERSKIIKQSCLSIYEKASAYAESKGIIIADTKMEFGLLNNEVILIDELLTPDSSRFWDAQEYEPGKNQASFDKQFVRDYLVSIRWDKKLPAPKLPEDVIKKTSEKYRIAYEKILERKLLTN
jgi:phosphoribosylaminoimidazole-succinocarboxamide synthase